VRAKVDIAGHRRQMSNPRLIDNGEEVLQFARAAVQTIEMPDHHSVNTSRLYVSQQPSIRGTCATGVRTNVVVGIDTRHAPTLARRHLSAVRFLARHARRVT
jgi:hypothetical protein